MEIRPVALAPLFWRVASESESEAQENGIELRAHATRGVVFSKASCATLCVTPSSIPSREAVF